MLYVNDIRVIPTIFPDKTSQIWNLPDQFIGNHLDYNISWTFENEGEIMHLAQLKSLLTKQLPRFVGLSLKYLPYGRQDKPVLNNATFALHSFAKLINSMDFDLVEITDPHSKEALRLINRSRASYPFGEFQKVVIDTKSDVLCYPDKGALEKYSLLFHGYPFIHGEKVRDQATGKITHYSLSGSQTPYEKVLIMDDICDGGATFVLLAKELYRAGVKEVNLFVTHGIFSKGLKPLYDAGIKRIFTQDGEASETWDYRTGSTITYGRL